MPRLSATSSSSAAASPASAARARLAKHDDVRVTLLDRNNYHQFQPLLYQVATSQLASSDIAYSLRKLFRDHDERRRQARRGRVGRPGDAHGDRPRTARRYTGDAHRAGGRLAAELLPHAGRARSTRSRSTRSTTRSGCARAILGVFEDADRDPALLDQGALNFVVVGGGADRRRDRPARSPT